MSAILAAEISGFVFVLLKQFGTIPFVSKKFFLWFGGKRALYHRFIIEQKFFKYKHQFRKTGMAFGHVWNDLYHDFLNLP